MILWATNLWGHLQPHGNQNITKWITKGPMISNRTEEISQWMLWILMERYWKLFQIFNEISQNILVYTLWFILNFISQLENMLFSNSQFFIMLWLFYTKFKTHWLIFKLFWEKPPSSFDNNVKWISFMNFYFY